MFGSVPKLVSVAFDSAELTYLEVHVEVHSVERDSRAAIGIDNIVNRALVGVAIACTR